MAQKAIGPTFPQELQTAGLTGLPFAWNPNGDITFGPTMTSAQIAAVETVYAAHNPALVPLAQQVAAALAAGLAITSTSTAALNGTYGVDATAQARLNAVSTYVLVNGNFPGGGTTCTWLDLSGAPHVFPTTASFQAFASIVASYVAALDVIALTNTGILPAPAATIP